MVHSFGRNLMMQFYEKKTVVRQAEHQTYLKNVLGALREYKLTLLDY